MVHILQTPTLGAAKTCDEPGNKEVVCHCDRRAGLGGLAGGLNSVAAMCTYRLGGLGQHPSSHHRPLFSSEFVDCGRYRLLVEGCPDVLGKMSRVGGSMRVEGAHSLSSKCQTAIPLPLPAVANPALRSGPAVPGIELQDMTVRSASVPIENQPILTAATDPEPRKGLAWAGTGWLQESGDPPTYEATGSPSLGRSERT